MKKLTAGIFATILGLTAIDAYAAIPTQNYVDSAVGSVQATASAAAVNAADALDKISKLDTTYVTEDELSGKGYATTGDVADATNDMATKTWVGNEKFLKEANLNGYAKTVDVVTNEEFTTFEATNSLTIADAKKAGTDAQKTADEALQGAEAANNVIGNLKSAAYTEADAYATAAQGAKADTALQKVTCSNPDGCVLMADGTIAELVDTYDNQQM